VVVYTRASPLPDVVKAHEKRLRQVLLNLLGNAVREPVLNNLPFSEHTIVEV